MNIISISALSVLKDLIFACLCWLCSPSSKISFRYTFSNLLVQGQDPVVILQHSMRSFLLVYSSSASCSHVTHSLQLTTLNRPLRISKLPRSHKSLLVLQEEHQHSFSQITNTSQPQQEHQAETPCSPGSVCWRRLTHVWLVSLCSSLRPVPLVK